MMPPPDRHKAALLIMGKLHPHDEPDGDEGGEDSGLDASAEEILSAMEAKDAKALSSALGSFLDQYESMEDSDGEP